MVVFFINYFIARLSFEDQFSDSTTPLFLVSRAFGSHKRKTFALTPYSVSYRYIGIVIRACLNFSTAAGNERTSGAGQFFCTIFIKYSLVWWCVYIHRHRCCVDEAKEYMHCGRYKDNARTHARPQIVASVWSMVRGWWWYMHSHAHCCTVRAREFYLLFDLDNHDRQVFSSILFSQSRPTFVILQLFLQGSRTAKGLLRWLT